MCVVSMVSDYYKEKWTEPKSPFYPYIYPNPSTVIYPVDKKEFDKLKAEVEEMKELLRRSKLYDIENNEPDCEIDEKMKLLQKIAEIFGVDLSEITKKGT